jgi:hypothetical protein
MYQFKFDFCERVRVPIPRLGMVGIYQSKNNSKSQVTPEVSLTRF